MRRIRGRTSRYVRKGLRFSNILPNDPLFSSIDFYILQKAINRNVHQAEAKVIETQTRKLEKLTRNTVLPFTANETVTNISTCCLTSEQRDILKFRLSHSICPPRISKTDVFTCFELIVTSHALWQRNSLIKKHDAKLVADLSHLAHSYESAHRPATADRKKYRILKDLKKKQNIVILKPDKGNGVVVLDRIACDNGILKIIIETSKFRPIKEELTLLREGRVQRFLRKILKNGHLDRCVYDKIYPSGSQPARIYGLPKMHEAREPNSIPPFRPIVSSIGTYNYELAKYVCILLEPRIPSENCALDTFTFVGEINELPLSGKFRVSFDVESLFTNIPLEECVNLAVDYIFKANPDLQLTKTELRNLFNFATAQTHFLFKGSFFDQIDGVAMGSTLAPVSANLFMGHHERIWLENCKASSILFYQRYVDDTFCPFDTEHDATLFFDYINDRHPNIRFTMEKEMV